MLVLRVNRTKQLSDDPLIFRIEHNGECMYVKPYPQEGKKSEFLMCFEGPKNFNITKMTLKELEGE